MKFILKNIKRVLTNSNWIMRVLISFFGIKIGRNYKFSGVSIMLQEGVGSIIIGENFTSNSSFLSNLIGLYQRSVIIARNGKVSIGNNVGISGTTIYSRKSIEIGDHCKIGANTKIIDNDFHSLNPEQRIIDDEKDIKSKEIIIGKNVFIGCNSIILKGTKLGDNCIVGAGSVVSGEFETDCVIAGNPARVIKKCEYND